MRHTVPPTAQQNSYDLSVEQTLRFPLKGDFIEGASIRIHGDIQITTAPNTGLANTNNVYSGAYISPLPGAHALIDGLIVETGGPGRSLYLETVNNYAFAAAAVLGASEDSRDVVRSSKSTMELRSGLLSTFAPAVAAQAQGGSLEANHLTFSLKPICSLTKLPLVPTAGRNFVLTIRTNPSRVFLVNNSGAAVSVTMSNVFVSYQSWSADGGDRIVKMTPELSALPALTTVCLPVPIKSGQETVALNLSLGGPCLGWFGIFLPDSARSAQGLDSFAAYQPPGLSRIRFLWNGMDLAQRFPYVLASGTNDPLLLYERASSIVSLLGTGMHGKDGRVTGVVGARDRDQTGAAFVIGERFDPALPIDGTGVLSVEIWSDVSSADPWTGYLSFIVPKEL